MKDNDFNVIKETFDNSGVNAPDALQADALLERLPEQPLQVLSPKPRKRKTALKIAAVAAVAVVTAFALTLTGIFNSMPSTTLLGETASLRSFRSRAEVKEELKRVIAVSESINGQYETVADPESNLFADGASEKMGGSDIAYESGSSAAHNSTYTQSLGVDEADIVKTNGKYIFYLCDNQIDIFSVAGKQSQKVAAIREDDLSPQSKSDYSYICEFYVLGDRLVLLWQGALRDSGGSLSRVTAADVFDLTDISALRRVSSFTQSGDYVDSRMIGDTLYLISGQWIADEDTLPRVSRSRSTGDSAVAEEIPYSDIFAVQTPGEKRFTVVSRVDTAAPGDADTKAVIGAADTVYCNQEHLYLTAPQYSAGSYDKLVNSTVNTVTFEPAKETQIVKIDLQNGLSFAASASVTGLINNQYALDEYNGDLRVATTTNADWKLSNHLFVLDGALHQLGSVTGFAENESIRAVRYINDTAYVITYEQTDPLFVIDVSDPRAPQITGEVEISGFSTLLVPVDDSTLLGIGYHTENTVDETDEEMPWGVKLVTFDVGNKRLPAVLDSKVYQNCDSPVQYDPKALLVNAERGDYTIPMQNYPGGDGQEVRCEALTFRVDNGKIMETDRYTSEKLRAVERCVYVGDTVYLLGTQKTAYDDALPETEIDCVPYKN